MAWKHAAIGALMTGALAGTPAAAQEMVSTYTRHDYEKCRKSPAGNDLAETICTGAVGIKVRWTAEADSSSVNFGERGIGESLFEGLDFFEAGNTIEWLGPKGGRPIVAIVRYRAGKRIGNLDVNRLVVHRIGVDGVSCIVGSVDGRKADANAQARKLADARGRDFRCGQDKRSDG
jgi:hypothetical protein